MTRKSCTLASRQPQVRERGESCVDARMIIEASGPISRMRTAGSPRLHYLEWNPSGARTLVLLHGVTANAWWWEEFARCHPGGLRLLALDHRGHGDSQWVTPPAYSPADYADDIGRFIDFCGVKDAVIVGHSQGGINALAFIPGVPAAARAVAAIDIALTSTVAPRSLPGAP